METLTKIILDGKFEIQEAKFATVDHNWSHIVSFYPFNRLYYVVDGEAKMQFHTTVYHLKKGMLYYIPEKSIVSGECQHSMSHYYLHFQTDSYLGNLLRMITKPFVPCELSVTEGIFQTLIDSFGKQTPGDELRCNGALQMLLANFFAGTEAVDPNKLRFIEMLSYINENITKKLTVTELANLANLSPVYFSNSFMKAFAITPQGYILSHKLKYACTLLLDRRNSVKQIAFLLNFADEAHFSRTFKKKLGISPSEFRNKISL